MSLLDDFYLFHHHLTEDVQEGLQAVPWPFRIVVLVRPEFLQHIEHVLKSSRCPLRLPMANDKLFHLVVHGLRFVWQRLLHHHPQQPPPGCIQNQKRTREVACLAFSCKCSFGKYEIIYRIVKVLPVSFYVKGRSALEQVQRKLPSCKS